MNTWSSYGIINWNSGNNFRKKMKLFTGNLWTILGKKKEHETFSKLQLAVPKYSSHFEIVSPPRVRNRAVADALHELTFYRHKGCSRLAWSSWISGTLGTMSSIALNISEDVHQRRFVSNGIFSTRSAYRAFFIGSTSFEPWKRIWKSWAPGKCKIFIWLAIRNRCWTADRLQKKGLPHPAQCPLCDQEGETVQHLLTFVSLLDNFGLTSYSPWI